ncbi:MAG TPA: hypothetical protein VG410_00875 [Solirubrobacteraceae bacterium]|jgi:hypothetical protein|nr:hypothetical protein [Solirubrobacteraceae bacterium]
MHRIAEGSRRLRLLGGGTDGNEQLTAIIAVVLTILLLVIGVTIIRIGQLTWLHLFVGLLLIGPVVGKLGSTGYRFIRYYTRTPEYLRRGPPELYLRLSAPLLVLMTVAVFVTGVVLLFLGPADRGSWVEIHKVTFIVWGAMFAIHFLGHLPEMPGTLSASVRRYGAGGTPGDSGRWITLAGALVAGLVLAVVLIPDFHSWTAPGAFPHHHHH